MIVPSIDLEAGHAVQLIGGAEKALDAGDPRPLARRYGRVGEIAVVDLDAALGKGSNAAVIRDLLDLAPCRVGGGIRDAASAVAWLDRGAQKVVLGTAARAEVLEKLPRERVIAALDARHGEVVVEGWQKGTGQGVLERIAALRGLAGGFLVTFVEREGRLQGTDLGFAKEVRAAAGDAAVTIAGGITTADEVAELDRLGCAAQVGMALYTDRLPLAEAFAAPLQSDRPDGLWPTVVVDERGIALGLCYSDLASLRAALERGQGVYHSRTRGLWVKGATSGAAQELLRVDADCDRDCAALHRPPGAARLLPPGNPDLLGRRSRPGRARPPARRTQALRRRPAPTRRSFSPSPSCSAPSSARRRPSWPRRRRATDVIHEAADVLYFTLATLARHGVDLAEVEAALDRRALKVTRRS